MVSSYDADSNDSAKSVALDSVYNAWTSCTVFGFQSQKTWAERMENLS